MTNKEIEEQFDKQFGMFFKDLPFEVRFQEIVYKGNMNQIRVPLLDFIYSVNEKNSNNEED